MCSLVKSSPVHREKWLSLTLQMEILLITLALIGLCVSTLWDIAANRIVHLYVSPILIHLGSARVSERDEKEETTDVVYWISAS